MTRMGLETMSEAVVNAMWYLSRKATVTMLLAELRVRAAANGTTAVRRTAVILYAERTQN